MENQLQQSAGELLRSVLRIYRRNFPTIFLTYVLPAIPLILVQLAAAPKQMGIPLLLAIVASYVLSFSLALAPITIAVSDICVGNRASVRRSYARTFSALGGKLMFTAALLVLGLALLILPAILVLRSPMAGGARTLLFLLLVIPAALAAVRLLFTPVVTALEGYDFYGPAALKRSADLGRGYTTRSAAVFLMALAGTQLVNMLLDVLLSVFLLPPPTGPVAAPPEPPPIFKALAILFQTLLQPLPLIAVVLLYHDLRARKEGRDIAALTEDLRR